MNWGVESTSLEPRRQFKPQNPRSTGADEYLDRAIFSPTSLGDPDMGQAGEKVAFFRVTFIELHPESISSFYSEY